MNDITFAVLNSFDNDLIDKLTKLELENLGAGAALNEWQIPVIIRYGRFIIAKNPQQKIVGACQALRSWKDAATAFIHSFYISKELRNKGVGKKLLKYSIDLFFIEGLSRIELTVDPENEAAVSLYKKIGFKVLQLKKDEYGTGNDRYLMFLKI